MSLSIVSPKTGKWVKVGSKVYNELLGDKNYASKVKKQPTVERIAKSPKKSPRKEAAPPPRAVKKQLARAIPQKLSLTLESLPQSRVARRQQLKELIKNQGDKRGSKTRGWGAAAPQRGRERDELKEKCGDDCFLLPNKNAFPVCAALRTKQGCTVDCRGIIAAKVRAGQWKYEDVKKAAIALEKKYGC